MEAQDFWDRVKLRLGSSKTTLKDLGKATGISFRTLETQISHKTFPRADIVFRISKALNTSVEYLLTGSDDYALRDYQVKWVSWIKKRSVTELKALGDLLISIEDISENLATLVGIDDEIQSD